MKNRTKQVIKVLVFLLILAIVVLRIQDVLRIGDYSIYSTEVGFSEEEKGSLDGVFVGASNVFRFFEPPLAWYKYGITVFNYSITSMPFEGILYRVIEARKTQPDALYIINLNSMKYDEINEQMLHRNLDYMPLSLNKLKMADAVLTKADIHGFDRLEYYFPIIRFHSRWSELTVDDFDHGYRGMKGADINRDFLEIVSDQSGEIDLTEEREELPDDLSATLDNLLTYLEKENVKTLFITVPQIMPAVARRRVNAGMDYVRDRGFECLDLSTAFEEIGISRETDYHDYNHLNIHGAIKFTDYLGRYLQEHYGFADKRGTAGTESWDIAVKLYEDSIGRNTLAFERQLSPRDYDMELKVFETENDGRCVTYYWEPVKKADEYLIYRKSEDPRDDRWTYIGSAAPGTNFYTDCTLRKGIQYTYTVVPCRSEGGIKYYGSFSYTGRRITL